MAQFKIMCWNVQNFFLPSHEDGPDAQGFFDAKVSSLVNMITFVKPDVLALQEVGPNALQILKQNLLGNHDMPHSTEGISDKRGIRVAFLSTLAFKNIKSDIMNMPVDLYPVQSADSIFNDPLTLENESKTNKVGRGILEVTVDFHGEEIILLNAHFKSKLISFKRKRGVVDGSRFSANDEGERHRYSAYAIYKRTIEAVTARHRLNEILGPNSFDPAAGIGNSKSVIFCGDLNDEVEAATTQIIKGPSGSELRNRRAFNSPDKGDGYRMWNLSDLLSRLSNGEEPYTRKYKGRGEIIDHIFASHRLVNLSSLPKVELFFDPDPLPNMDDLPNSRRNETGSDHAAVVATFDFNNS